MTHKLRVGVVGTSGYSDFMYLSFLEANPYVELVAVCGQNRERGEQRASQHHIPLVFTDYRQMIREANLDGVIVAAPDDLHYEITMQALSAGLHVICEKPLANSAGQALEMFQAAEKAGVKHQVTFTYRWMPVFDYMRDLVTAGYLGRCYHAEFRYLMGHGRTKGRGDYWRYDQKRTNGNLADMGAHMIDMSLWLLGGITRVNALTGMFVDVPEIPGTHITPSNDTAFLLTEFDNRAQGSIFCSRVAHIADRFMQQEIRLYGQDGSLELNVNYDGNEVGAFLRGACKDETQFHTMPLPAKYGRFEPPFDWSALMGRQGAGCGAWVDAILEDRPASPSFYDGWKVQLVIDAALESHRAGTWVPVQPE